MQNPLNTIQASSQVADLVSQIEAQSASMARTLLLTLQPELSAQVLSSLGCARVLELLDDAVQQERDDILALLAAPLRERWILNAEYPARTVGRFLESTAAIFKPSALTGAVIQALLGVMKNEFITYCFVEDEAKKLIGVVTMRELLFAAPSTPLAEIMITNPFTLTPETALDTAVRLVVKKHFPVYPIVTATGEMLGVVRGSRLFEAQAIEISAQSGSMVGVEKEERLATTWKRSFKLRHPWLQINLFTAFLAGGVVTFFQGTIDSLVILAAFLPVLAGQSGNTGCQALAVTIRGVTLGDYKAGTWSRLVHKEAMLGLMNGFFVGLVAALGMYVMATMQANPRALILSAVVLCAMMGSCVISGVSGVLVPISLKRLGFDPATASSIFLTTATDVASMGMLLGLATLFVM